MKGALIFLYFSLFSLHLYSQSEVNFCCADDFWCYTVESKPLIRSNEIQLENQYRHQITIDKTNARGGVIVLPVVVHIIHDNGPENISDSRVQSMIDELNDGFRNRNAFHSDQGVDFEVEFCLAQRDTQGLATNGIIRHQSIYTDMSLPSAFSQINSIATWDPQQYINIRLVREVCDGQSCNAAGYASMPAGHGASFDGLTVEAKYAGNTNDNASVIIHEMGHYLGLLHTFQGGCKNNDCLTDGDHVCDTPPDNMTGSYPCDVHYNSCLTDEDDPSLNNPFRSIALGGFGDQYDMIENYMDYSAYPCYDRFTLGQKDRVLFFLNSARSSLLSSKSCLTPCTNQPIAFFSTSDDTIYAGETVFLTNLSQFASQYSWYINGIPVGHATDTSFVLTTPGTYLVTLVAENNLPECNVASFETEIIVQCQAQSGFSYSVVNDSLFVYDQSAFSDSIKWMVNDGAGMQLFTSHQTLDTFNLSGIGYIQICQDAYNEYCVDRHCIYVSLTPPGVEICNNQIDDDGDGLVDLFDPDCPCSDSTFQAVCEQPCQILTDNFPDLSMHLKWQSSVIGNYTDFIPNIIVGKMNRVDNRIEIATRKSLGDFPPMGNVENKIMIIDGNSGTTNTEFISNPGATYHDVGFLAMGDIDKDGFVEFFCKDWDSLFCYNSNGSLRWISEKLNMGERSLINLADFNGDGVVEVYAGNNIINAENGKVLANSPLSSGCNIPNGALFTSCVYGQSIASDLLPSPGLELAAGNVVYEVQLNNLNGIAGNNLIPVTAEPPVLDGITSVGDIDGDGELDVIVVRNISFPDGGGIWVWNPRTRAVIASAPSGPSGGVPFVGDVDGDCLPEIGMTFSKELRMYKYNGTTSLQLLYNLPTTDKSGYTGITMFDFNQDGKNELVYRDETELRIIKGSDGTTLASYPIKSGTGLEYPVIADVDQDGEADIIVNGYLNDPAEQRVFCLEGSGSRWAPARKVWNQPGYNVTNVNDDLTIPRYPQNPAKPLPGHEFCLLDTCATPYNAFNVQATYRTQAGCVQFPAHDLSIHLLSYTCHPDSITICLSVENTTSLTIRQELIPFTAWPANPFLFNTSPIFSFDHLLDLKAHEVDTICYTFPMMDNLDSMYIVTNDPGSTPTPYSFPVSSLAECNYDNNIGLFHMELATHTLDLGPDIIKCESEVITLHAGPDFISYTWSDNSIDSIYSSSFAGLHFVEATDHCGRIYKDTVNFQINALNEIDLGNDTTICAGKPVPFNLTGNYDWINWLPSNTVNCDTCATIELTTDTSLTLIAVAGIGNCLFQDTIAIQVKQPSIVDTILKTCSGDTLLFRTLVLASEGQYIFEVEPCDTLFNITVDVNTRDSTYLTTRLCANDSLLFNGTWLHSSGLYTQSLINERGCDSIVKLDLSIAQPISHTETISACDGDSIFVFNQWFHSSAVLQDTLTSVLGCDSIVKIDVLFNPYLFQTDSIYLCQGDSIWIRGVWVRTSGTFIDTISNSPCDIIQKTEVKVISTSINTEHFVLCPGDSIQIGNAWIISPTTIQDTTQNSFGCDSINQITIDVIPTPNAPTFTLDCANGTVDLFISVDPLWRILWSNGDTTNQTTYFNSNTAGVILSADPACQKEFLIDLPAIPLSADLPDLKDTMTDVNHPLLLQLPLNENEWSVEWFPSDLFSCSTCLITSLSVNQDTEIKLILTHEDGCVYVDSFTVFVADQSPNFYIPNVFSPNGDGQNDTWHIFYDASKGNIELLEIFDRWGNMVHRGSQSENLDWDGTFHEQLVSSGVFTYKVLFRPKNGSLEVMCGDVTLIR